MTFLRHVSWWLSDFPCLSKKPRIEWFVIINFCRNTYWIFMQIWIIQIIWKLSVWLNIICDIWDNARLQSSKKNNTTFFPTLHMKDTRKKIAARERYNKYKYKKATALLYYAARLYGQQKLFDIWQICKRRQKKRKISVSCHNIKAANDWSSMRSMRDRGKNSSNIIYVHYTIENFNICILYFFITSVTKSENKSGIY